MVSADGREKETSRMTIRDIAALSGVSVATVSRALNGRPDVSPVTRDAILRLVHQHGYTTNRSARGLVGGRTDLVGLMLPFVHTDYFSKIMAGASEALYQRDIRFVLCPTLHQHDREVSLLSRLMHGTTDGAMLLLPSETSAELAQLRRHNYPFVVVDPREPLGEEIPVVSAAHLSGARAAVEHLASLGHQRIGVITGVPGWYATVDRLDGYRSALLAAGLPFCPELVREGDWNVESGYHAALELLRLSSPPTAIFAFNDNMAIGALRAAKEFGVRVPDDLSLVGFDDSEAAAFVDPPLTTVRQPLEEMGRLAAGLLYRLLDGQRVEVTRLELSTRLIVRQSTAPPTSAVHP